MVIGSMQCGIASVSEAAAVGVLIVSGIQVSLNRADIVDAAFGPIWTISMIGRVVARAFFLLVFTVYLGVSRNVAAETPALELSPLALMPLGCAVGEFCSGHGETAFFVCFAAHGFGPAEGFDWRPLPRPGSTVFGSVARLACLLCPRIGGVT